MTRRTLPTRRPCITTDTNWHGQPMSVSIGFDPATGDPLETFADARGASSRHGQIGEIIRDAATTVSWVLQLGATPDALAKSLGTVPTWVNGAETTAPASPVGTILAVIREVQP